MSEDEVVERHSMVGAPPSSSRRGGPSLPTRSAKNVGKRKREEDTDDDDESEVREESEVGEHEDSADDREETVTPGKPRKKRRRGSKPLTDAIQRKKRSEAKRAAEKEAKLLAGYVSPVEEPQPLSPVPEEPPEPVVQIPKLSSYSPFQLMCDHLLRKVQSKDPDEYFAFPVTESVAPDYHNIISKPMDFSTIRNKIEENLYESIVEVRQDSELIVSNALSYNNPNTVYHLAATRLAGITRYYFSEQYIRYLFHTLPFSNRIPLEKAGLTPLAPLCVKQENKRREAVSDTMTAEDCLKTANPIVRDKLTKAVPAKIGFLDNKEGATVLNILGSEEKNIRLIDIVGTLEEGNPGMISLGDHRLSSVSAINYLNYGPFCSFAPQYDSTWASLTKQDSDLLLRTYGDRSTVSDVVSLRNMVMDSSSHFIKVVDDMLDTLTDGEHSRAMSTLQRKDEPIKDSAALEEVISEVESLENLGIDVSFLADLKQTMGINTAEGLQSELNASGRQLMDLARLQHDRLSKQPPPTLTKVSQPGPIETQLANNVQQKLTQQMSMHAPPSQLVSAPTIHKAIGLQDEFDMDILGEFFVT